MAQCRSNKKNQLLNYILNKKTPEEAFEPDTEEEALLELIARKVKSGYYGANVSDELIEQFITEYLTEHPIEAVEIANNLTTATTGKALDATQGKALKELLDALSERIDNLPTGGGTGGGTADVPVATTSTAGKVKPDGTTITVTSDGTISATATTPDLSNYQTKTDSSLTTTAKTIVGAINEVKATASAGVDSATITSAVNAYMTEHPVSATVGNDSVYTDAIQDESVTYEKLDKDLLNEVQYLSITENTGTLGAIAFKLNKPSVEFTNYEYTISFDFKPTYDTSSIIVIEGTFGGTEHIISETAYANKFNHIECTFSRTSILNTITVCTKDSGKVLLGLIKNLVIKANNTDISYTINLTGTSEYIKSKVLTEKEYVDTLVSNNSLIYLPTNLFDYKAVTVGKSLKTDGTLENFSSRSVSDFIEVIPDTTYVKNTEFPVVWYDDNKSVLGKTTQGVLPITSPKSAKYARLTTNNSTVEGTMFIEGDTLPYEYIPYGTPFLSYQGHELVLLENTNGIIPKYPHIEKVACYGDSLTSGYGVNQGYSYPDRLSTYIDKKVVNRGTSSEKTSEIAFRQGGVAGYAQPFTIPSDKSAVNVTIKTLDKETISVKGTVPVTIAGVSGQLTVTTTPGVLNFNRITAGDEVVLTRPTRVFVTMSKEDERDILVIFAGTNDNITPDNMTTVIQKIRSIIEHSKCANKKYIVIGYMHTTGGGTTEQIAEVNKYFSYEFGEHFIDIKDYLINYGLDDAGLSATDSDTTAISEGSVPPSVMSDRLHLNNYGYDILAKQVAKKGAELGYWNLV